MPRSAIKSIRPEIRCFESARTDSLVHDGCSLPPLRLRWRRQPPRRRAKFSQDLAYQMGLPRWVGHTQQKTPEKPHRSLPAKQLAGWVHKWPTPSRQFARAPPSLAPSRCWERSRLSHAADRIVERSPLRYQQRQVAAASSSHRSGRIPRATTGTSQRARVRRRSS